MTHVQIPQGILRHPHCLDKYNPRQKWSPRNLSHRPYSQHSILFPSNTLSFIQCLSGCQDHSCRLFIDSGLGHRVGRKQWLFYLSGDRYPVPLCTACCQMWSHILWLSLWACISHTTQGLQGCLQNNLCSDLSITGPINHIRQLTLQAVA